MNRKEILKEINYNGVYTKETKKKLRELLKKYHPDHYKKESDTFKMINEIKKELDAGKKISFEENKEYIKSNNEDDYKITEEIIELTKKMNQLVEKRKNCKKEFDRLQAKYRIEYDNDIDFRNQVADSTNNILEIQSKRQKYNILLIVSVLLTVLFIFTKWYYALIITVILFVYAIYNFTKIDISLNEELSNNQKTMKVSENSVKKIHSITDEMNSLYKQIWDLDCDINRLTTKINLLKAKIR